MSGIKLLVSGFLVRSLAQGLQAFHKEATIQHERDALGEDFAFATMAKFCETAVSGGWVILTRYSSPKAAPGELVVLRQSGATVLMLAPALAELKHDAIGQRLLAMWPALISEVAAHPGQIIEVPARRTPPPWKLL